MGAIVKIDAVWRTTPTHSVATPHTRVVCIYVRPESRWVRVGLRRCVTVTRVYVFTLYSLLFCRGDQSPVRQAPWPQGCRASAGLHTRDTPSGFIGGAPLSSSSPIHVVSSAFPPAVNEPYTLAQSRGGHPFWGRTAICPAAVMVPERGREGESDQ